MSETDRPARESEPRALVTRFTTVQHKTVQLFWDGAYFDDIRVAAVTSWATTHNL